MKKPLDIIEDASKVFDRETPIIDRKFLVNNIGKIVFVVILLLFYIELGYDYEAAISDIDKLKTELADVRYTSIERWGVLTSRNKPDIIREKIASSDIELKNCDEPPILVK